MSTERFRVNRPAVIDQTIDGEAVIIHLDRGFYYSLDALGAVIWDRLASGSSPDRIARSLQGEFATDPSTFSAAVTALVDRLRSEELILPESATDGATDPTDPTDGAAPSPTEDTAGPGSRPFSPPRLQRYDDLQDLLLLDPIHAVDESGWPERPGQAPNQGA